MINPLLDSEATQSGQWSWSTRLPTLRNILFISFLCAALLRWTYLAFLHPLSKYPGPKLWAISRVPWAYHVVKGDLWHSLNKFHNKYGPVVRIAPDELTYIQPESWKDIYTMKPDLNKEPRSLTPPLNGANSLFTATGDDHKRIRGAFAHAFSEKASREQAGIIEMYAQQLILRVQTELRGSPSRVVDIQKIIGYAAFDIISDFTWGESPGALQSTVSQNWGKRFFLHAQFSTIRNCLSYFTPLDRALHYVFLTVTSKQRIANTKLTTKQIDRRIALGHSRSDFMTPIIGKISEEGHKGITKSEVLTNGLAIIIANSQLTTTAITSTIYFLLHNPRCLKLLAEEIAGLAFNDESDIKVSTTQPLPYLNAVINESLRLHHPTPTSLVRVAPKEGFVVAGRFVPGGSVIGVNLYTIHRRSENFKAPLEFHPERFLDKTDARYDPAYQDDRLDAFHPFSMGQRNCIGSRMFLAEARVILTKLIWRFDTELAEPNPSSWLEQKAWLVFEPRPLRVRLQER